MSVNGYISADAAAEKWGISRRRVYSLCKNNRITGLIRFENRWLIPENVDKPTDDRRIIGSTSSNYFLSSLPIMLDCGDDLELLRDNKELRPLIDGQLNREALYFQGKPLPNESSANYDSIPLLSKHIIGKQATINAGDFNGFNAHRMPLDIAAGNPSYRLDPSRNPIKDLSNALASLTLYHSGRCCSLVKSGVFPLLPESCRSYATVLHCKYLLASDKPLEAASAAKAALSMLPVSGYKISKIYLNLTIADALITLYETENTGSRKCKTSKYESSKYDAEIYFKAAIKLAAPFGYILPFAENMVKYAKFTLDCILKNQWSAAMEIKLLASQLSENMHFMISKICSDNISLILNPEDRLLLTMVKAGCSDSEIAKIKHKYTHHIRIERRKLYRRLGITRREQLAAFEGYDLCELNDQQTRQNQQNTQTRQLINP